MLKRDENDKLYLSYVGLELFLDDLFQKCKTQEEIEWLEATLQFNVEIVAELKKENYI